MKFTHFYVILFFKQGSRVSLLLRLKVLLETAVLILLPKCRIIFVLYELMDNMFCFAAPTTNYALSTSWVFQLNIFAKTKFEKCKIRETFFSLSIKLLFNYDTNLQIQAVNKKYFYVRGTRTTPN